MSIEVNCPNCNQSLEADDEMRGMEVNCPGCNKPFNIFLPQQISGTSEVRDCPYCGEEILSKAKKCKHCGEFLDGSMKQSAQTNPEQKSIPEKVLWEGHTSHMYFLGAHILWGIIAILTLGIGLLGNLYYFLSAKSMRYKLTNKRLLTEKGVLSKHTAEVAIKDIRSINMKQGIFEKIFGLGTVEIGTAGTAGIEITFAGISQAPKVKDQITKLKNEL
jgi:membrane protein YdbS with pleckstrin-like domain/DNA-directed RNA polymerase subunit RPC12/RpoP